METKAVWVTVLIFAVVLFLGASAEAQLAKKGTYSGVFGFHFTGSVVELEKDRVTWGGPYSGLFRNDTGDGFLHAASGICTGSGEMNKGSITHDYGDCVMTDKEGDKAFMTWQCPGCPLKAGMESGEFQWTGGTGKFAGLRGRNSWQVQNVVGQGPSGLVGWAAWKGEWELP
jgi:hypothetical protein